MIYLTISLYEKFRHALNVIREARRRAEAMGTSVNQLVRDYLEQFVGKRDPAALAAELERLWERHTGDSHGWRFNRDEVHERNF